jgi:hypothetical protein
VSASWRADRPVHQHLRLDDRHDAGLLAERGVAGERVGVGVDAVLRRDRRPDVDHRAPLGEARAEFVVFGEPLAQAVEALGDLLARRQRQILATPGRVLPSSHSRKAPPAVET